MTPDNPDKAAVGALVEELHGFHDCLDVGAQGDGAFVIYDKNGRDSEQQRLNLRATLREAADALSRMAEEPRIVEWQPIETAPTDGSEILLCYPPDGKTVLKPRYGVGCYSDPLGKGGSVREAILWDWDHGYRPTLWMPISPPAPPSPNPR